MPDLTFAVRVVQWINRSYPMRLWSRLSQVRGNVLVRGIAFSGFFSLFPILALAFTGFSLFLRSRPGLQADLISYLSQVVPGVIKQSPDDAGGLIYPQDLVDDVTGGGVVSLAGAVGLLTLIWAALGWVSALRLGIRAAMHLPVADFHPVWAKIRDFLIALLLGGTIVVTAVAHVAFLNWTDGLAAAVGWSSVVPDRLNAQLATFAVFLPFDTLLFFLEYRLLAASPLPTPVLLKASLAAAVAFGVLKQAAGSVIPLLTQNLILAASFFVIFALLVWMDLVARVTLLAAAWAGMMAEEADDRAARVSQPGAALAEREALGLVDGAGRPAARAGPTGRAEDRVVLAAGLVLGATAAVGVRVLASAVGAVRGAADRDDDA